MFDEPSLNAVMAAMRTVAAEEILPRFKRLAAADITEKSGPFDLVTIADLESERRLTAVLTDLIPDSVVVGEEGCAASPERLTAISGPEPVWLIDPVDGTGNFVRGNGSFAVIVAFLLNGVTEAGWILDPLTGRIVWAVRGQGAWSCVANQRPYRLTVDQAAAKPISAMIGSLGNSLARRIRERREAGATNVPVKIVRIGSTGHDYLDLATGKLDFARYAGLKPWDHAAGVLIHAEAGGWSRLLESDRPYRAEPHVLSDTLLLAPDSKSARALQKLLDQLAHPSLTAST